jgi:hypothetical protein
MNQGMIKRGKPKTIVKKLPEYSRVEIMFLTVLAFAAVSEFRACAFPVIIANEDRRLVCGSLSLSSSSVPIFAFFFASSLSLPVMSITMKATTKITGVTQSKYKK